MSLDDHIITRKEGAKERRMIWIVKDVLDFVYHIGAWMVWGMINSLVWAYCTVARGLEYTVQHRGFWILISLFLGWHFSLHLSLMKTIEEFHYNMVIMTNTTFSNSSMLLDDVLKNTVIDPEAFSTLEVDDAVEFFGVEKSEMRLHLYYMVSTLVTLCATLIILFITEVIYFCTFGRLIFGHEINSYNKVEQIMKDIKVELFKIAVTLKYAKRDTAPAIAEIVRLLKEIRENHVFTTIMNGTSSSPMIENGDTSETTQASENSSEMGEVNSSHHVVVKKSKKRKV